MKPELTASQAAEIAWRENGPGELVLQELNRQPAKPEDAKAMQFCMAMKQRRGQSVPREWMEALTQSDFPAILLPKNETVSREEVMEITRAAIARNRDIIDELAKH